MFALLNKFASKSIKSVGLIMIVAATATVAYAQSASRGKPGGGEDGGGFNGAIPELDPGSVAQAVTFLCGSVLLLTDKIRRK